MKIVIILGLFYLVACQSEKGGELISEKKEVVKDSVINTDTLILENFEPHDCIDTLEQKLIDYGLVNIQELDSTILVDVKYASEDNFLGLNMYGSLNRIYLQPDVAKRLVKAQNKLKSIDSSKTLLVYDGVRPRSVQWKMWNSLKMPVAKKSKFVSNPRNGSLHNFGAAVDLTIADTNGVPIDMGANYDDIRRIAYPSLEKIYLDSGLISLEQIENRKLLRRSMRAGGFWVLQTEWWHFNSCRRDSAWVWYKIIE